MKISELTKPNNIGKADFPRLEGSVKIRLHNPTTGKNEVIEGKNIVTNAVADIFASNYGGLMDYDNLMPLYSKMFGGVLCFANALDDTTADDYGIPSQADNPIIAHAGQTTYTDAGDDITRGNPNSTGLVLTNGAVTQEWEWASSQGNGTISALALCHADIGNAGAGGTSNAFKALDPFIDVASKSRTTPTTINGSVMFAVKDNIAYSFSVTGAGVLTLYKTPVVHSKAGLQGTGLVPITNYTETTTINLGHNFVGGNACCFYYDFTNNRLLIFSAYDSGSVYSVTTKTLTIDTINLTNGTATSADHTLNLTDRYLWTFRTFVGGEGYTNIRQAYQAIVIGDYLYFPTCTEVSRPNPDGYIRINLTNFADVDEITNNTGDSDLFFVLSGGIAVSGSKAISTGGYLIDGTNLYKVATHKRGGYNNAVYYASKGNIAPYDGFNIGSLNRLIVSKLYLGTKFNLQTPVTKTAAQSMTVTYTLREI